MDVPEISRPGVTAQIPYLHGNIGTASASRSLFALSEVPLDRRTLFIGDGRDIDHRPTLDCEGFELFRWPSATVRDRLDDLRAQATPLPITDAMRAYWIDTLPLVRQVSGARDVYPVHVAAVRASRRGLRRRRSAPAAWAHLDYDAGAAEARLKETLALQQADPAPYSRFVLYQGWRVLSAPPQDYPLALCDARTVGPGDIAPFHYHGDGEDPDRPFRALGSHYNPAHAWTYYPDMTAEEMILFKGYDSDLEQGRKTLHVAFEDEGQDNPLPRISIETQYLALFD